MNISTSSVAYHDYLAMLISTDAEWSRRRIPYGIDEKDASRYCFKNESDLLQQCQNLRNKINENYRRFREGNSLPPLEKSEFCTEDKTEGYLSPYLYNPINYMPFGHADSLNVILLDDVDAIYYLTADNKTTVEQVDLLFCPKMNSVLDGIDAVPEIFCDLHEMISPTTNNSEIPHTHNFQQDYPLLVFTKFKISGILGLSGGIYLEQYIFRAMAKKIIDVWNKLNTERNEPVIKNFLGSEDGQEIDKIKICLVDLQGAEEIGVLVFCQNYSIAMSLVSSLRSLTFKHLYSCSAGDELKMFVENNEGFQNLIHLTKTQNDKYAEGNHIFRWSNSSLAICSGAFRSPGKYPCFGKVASSSEIQICPGHRLRVEQKINEISQKVKNYRLPKDFHACKAGIADILLISSDDVKGEFSNLIDLKVLIDFTRQNFTVFGSKEKFDHGRDIIDFITSLTIPVPFLKETFDENLDIGLHTSRLSETLILIQHRLFYSNVPIENFAPTVVEQAAQLPNGPNLGRLDFLKLKESLVKIGLPISLRRAIEYLYQYYATILADPFHFDMVLDLYDSFLTLYVILTDHLPQKCSKDNENGINSCDDGIILQIAEYLKATRNALQHRMAKAYPEPSIRDMGIDLRGGVNKILLGANSSLICGLDLFKRYQEECTGKPFHVGGLTSIGFLPGAKCEALNFENCTNAKIAYFEVDVAHIFHIASYSNYFHETFHLMFDAFCGKTVKRKIENDPQLKDRLSEIFSNLLCKDIIYDGDTEKFLFSTLTSFSKNPISKDRQDWDTVVRYHNMFLRLFMVTDKEDCIDKKPFERFRYLIEKYGFLCSEYERIWNGPYKESIYKYSEKDFYLLYPMLSKYMIHLKKIALSIKSFYRTKIDYNMISIVHDTIDNAFNSGTPIIAKDLPMDNLMNLSFLVCSMLERYTPSPVKIDICNKKVHLIRSCDRLAKYETSNKKWYEFQIEDGATSLFCPVPYYRKKRLLKQIVFLKSAWGYSLIQCQSRFNEIINDIFQRGQLVNTDDPNPIMESK